MATDKDTVTTEITTSRALALFVADIQTEKKIDEVVKALDPKMVPVLVARAVPIRRALQYVEKVAEARLASERILNFGDDWTDPEHGIIYHFAGEPTEWKVADPDGLRDALKRAGVAQRVIDQAIVQVWKVNHTALNAIGDISEEAREAISDFRTRGFAPAHLKEKK